MLVASCTPVRVDVRGSAMPGFDTSHFPGAAALRAWGPPGSPYRWVGYYLTSPCRRDTSWEGVRTIVESAGFGTAVIYVGQQAWEGAAVLADSASLAAPACSRSLLTGERGRADADDAIARARAEGFPAGTTIFLDLERMSAIPPEMRAYYRAWIGRLWETARYRPGIYAHLVNATELYADVESLRASAAGSHPPLRWWIGGGTGFGLDRLPRDVGVEFSNIWQGSHNVTERWNGVPLVVDVNVADRASPSAP